MNFFDTCGNSVAVLACTALVATAVTACSSADLAGNGAGGSATSTTGGAASTGGGVAAGGSLATGGAQSAAGGQAQATGGAASSTDPTWSQLYTNYFGPGTAGDCVASGCHGSGQAPAFNSAATMCSVLKSSHYIGAGSAGLSAVLAWFNQGGNMPANGNAAPPNAVADITAWQNAGAVCP